MDDKTLTPGEQLVKDARKLGFDIKDEKHPLDGMSTLSDVMSGLELLLPEDCAKLSARRLAKLCGLSERKVQRNMRGDSQPTAETLAAIVDGMPFHSGVDRTMVICAIFNESEYKSERAAMSYCIRVLGAIGYCGIDRQDLLSLVNVGLSILAKKNPDEINESLDGRLRAKDAARFLTRDHGLAAIECMAGVASNEEIDELYKAARAIAPRITEVPGEGVMIYSPFIDE